ncbi:MAG TPA: hypothetical protein DCQ93_03540, partial [Bacteroidetes bacterium]|nr:hypothetical protein [Bacteroidota bacterium]
MRTLKNIGLVLLGIILLLVIISLFLPSKVHVERTAVISGKPEMSFALVNDLHNWEKWSPWHRKDPNMKITYNDTASGMGASYSWTSDNSQVGNGSLKISKSNPVSFVETQMNFMENGTGTAGFNFEPAGTDSTKITWTMDSDMGWNLIGRFFGLMMDKFVGPDFEAGLHNLDSLVASMPKAPTYEITAVNVDSKPYLGVTDSASMSDKGAIGAKYGEMYGIIGAEMKKQKLNMANAPMGIMLKIDGDKFVWEAGMETDKPGKSSGRVIAGNTYAGEAAFVKYFGAYEKTQSAYEAVYKWIGEQGKSPNGNAWE